MCIKQEKSLYNLNVLFRNYNYYFNFKMLLLKSRRIILFYSTTVGSVFEYFFLDVVEAYHTFFKNDFI